jgi:cell division protein FtsX
MPIYYYHKRFISVVSKNKALNRIAMESVVLIILGIAYICYAASRNVRMTSRSAEGQCQITQKH